MRSEQFQRIYDAGRAGVSESRGLHFDMTSPAGYPHFLWIRRRQLLKVKFVYRVIISTLDLSSCCERRTFPAKQKACPGNEQTMKLGFFTMPIHPVDKDW